MKNNLVVICTFMVLISIFNVNAQQTFKYLDPLDLYKEAKEWYKLGDYPLAQQKFDACQDDNIKTAFFTSFHEMDAAYFSAVCSKKLAKEDASFLLSSFINKYNNNRQYNSLANYELGELFYQKKNFQAALSCFEEVYENDLDRNDFEHFKFIQAYSHFNLKEFDTAYDYFEQVTRYNGVHKIDATYYLGYLAFENKDFEKAVQCFLKIEDDKRYKNIIPYYITQIYYDQGKDTKVLAYAQPKLKQSGIKYKTQMNKIVGQTYYDKQQFGEALPYMKYYVDNSKKVSKEDLYLLAYTQYKYKDYENAIKNFLDLNTLTDEFGQNAMYHLADCYLKTDQKANARNAFKQASEMDVNPEIKQISAFNYAKLSFELGNQTDATDAILAYLQTYPNTPEANQAKSILAKIMEQTANYSQAIEIIESISDKNESLKKSYQRICYAKALDFYNQQQFEKAFALFDKSKIYPLDNNLKSLAHYWKANMLYDQGNYQAAEAEFFNYLKNPGPPTENVSPGLAYYTMAYAYFTKKEYKTASRYFADALKSLSNSDQVYADAVLRSGDCYFINREYGPAKQKYEEVIKRKIEGADYATYQNGMIAGLQQNYSEKINILQSLNKRFPKSNFNDDALYQIAITQALQQQYNPSLISLLELIKKYPEGKYYRQSLLDIGVMYYNIDDYDPAIIYYERAIKEFPNSAEAKQAVFNLKEVYMAKGDSDAYFDYIEDSPDIEISTSGQDTIMYQFAESFYEKGDCLNAVAEFNKYIKNHPRGAYVLSAHFYRGDCLYQNKKYSRARDDFDFIIKQRSNMFSEKALMRGARIAFVIDKNDEKAFQYYRKLLDTSSDPSVKTEALKGLTKSAYSLGNDKAVKEYGNLLLLNKRASQNDKLEANFFLSKIAYKSGDLNTAQSYFKTVAIKNNAEVGAEARYLLAEILYQQKKYNESKEACFRVDRETPEQEYWVVNSFILLGDIYKKQGELFQAKQTLKSIVDNYDGDLELLEKAKKKYSQILNEEKSKSKLEDEKENSKLLELDEEN